MMRLRSVVEIALWTFSLASVSFLAQTKVSAATSRRQAEEVVNHHPEAAAGSSARSISDGVMGRLEIPALHLSVPISNGIDDATLRSGVGHVPGTALLGGLGNAGLAGHRDTYFRPLRGIKPGMAIVARNRQGAYTYLVDSTEIVDPDEIHVLDTGSRPEMTLITCYPFIYVGAAPRRFIVHAHLSSLSPM